jgi:choline-glycine betaine transporter
MSDKPLLSLNDLIGLHYKQVDLVHKFWNYMWLAGAAAITVSASVKALASILLIGYLPFALTNVWLVFGAQKEASLSAKAIRAIAESPESTLAPEVKAVLMEMRPWPPWLIAALHGLLTSFVVGVQLER